jgi:molybdopterin synthase catalytic subunit
MAHVAPPVAVDDWIALVDGALPVAAASDWVVRRDCGAVVTFSGTARDHAHDRHDVRELVYEAYEEQAVPRIAAIVAEARRRWPVIGRVAMLHRLGLVPLGESAVVVAVSAPHRGEAFAAAQFGIDALKATVPIWKRERWDGGESWGLDAQHVTDLSDWLGQHDVAGAAR